MNELSAAATFIDDRFGGEASAARFPGVVAAQGEGYVLADNGGGAQVPRECVDAVARFLEHGNAQKGAPFQRKVRVTSTIAQAKSAFAELIGVAPETVGFGLNATSIAFTLARTLAATIRPGDRIVVTDADHSANLVPWAWLTRFGAEIVRIGVDRAGELDEAAYAAALAAEPVLVALPWASNATGAVFDVARLAAAAKDAGALVIVDGVQAAPHLCISIPAAIDAVFFSGYKIYAPHFGAWYADHEFARRFFTADDPLIPSAPAYWSIETGTQNHEGLTGWLGTAAYLRSLSDGDIRGAMRRIESYERELTEYALERFADRSDTIALYGRRTAAHRLPVFSFNLRDGSGVIDPHTVAHALDAAKIEASAGDYYAPRLLRTLVPETNAAVRLSFAHYTSREEIDRCFTVLDRYATG